MIVKGLHTQNFFKLLVAIANKQNTDDGIALIINGNTEYIDRFRCANTILKSIGNPGKPLHAFLEKGSAGQVLHITVGGHCLTVQ